MLSRAFALVLGKGTRRPLDLSVQASTTLRRCSHMPQQLHHLNRRPDDLPQEQHPLQNNIRGAPPACVFEPNWTMQHSFSPMENSAYASLASIRDRSFDERFATLMSIGDCTNEDELRLLLKKKTVPICYVWCDPTPWMHITQGISMTINVNKMVKAGCRVKILMADWFARMDLRIGGNLSKMQTVGRYNIEMWKATGMYLDGVEFVRLSDEINCHADEYWALAMDIARKSDLGRIKESLRVHASKDTRGHGSMDPYDMMEFNAAEIFNPCLQCAGILLQKVDIWLLGLDQRGANMLARQYCKCMERENKPIALFHNLLPNLLEDPALENWDDPRWAIFMEDNEEGVSRKIKKAFCPPELAEGNPCLEYIKYIILPWFGKFEVGKGENGGNKTFLSMEEFTRDYESGVLHPADVKKALLKAINMILQPVRDHFRSSTEAKKLLKAMEEYRID